MARSDTRLHIALIAFILLTIMFSVFAFLFYRQASDNMARADSAEDQALAAKQAMGVAMNEANFVRAMLGESELGMEAVMSTYVPEGAMRTLKTQFDQDMQELGEGLPEGELNYPAIARHLVGKIKEANEQQIAVNAQTATTLQEQADQVTSSKAAEDRANTELESAKTAYATEVAKHEEDRKQLTAQIDNLDKEKLKLSKEKEDISQLAVETEERLQADIERLDNQIENVSTELVKITRPNFEVPDGKIVSVNQKTGRVWLNLGSADGLRRQTSFSVYPSDTIGVGDPDDLKVKVKAGIVVTEVLGKHFAVARITDPKIANPIHTGDIIYSPIFHPGRTIHVAISGVIDLNGDGRSDLDLVQNLIKSSGGKVDVVLREDGTTVGDGITTKTRFLVVGDEPEIVSGGGGTSYIEAYSSLETEAKRNGALKIKVDDLLNFMGWSSEVRIVSLGKGGSPAADSAGALEAPARGDDGSAF